MTVPFANPSRRAVLGAATALAASRLVGPAAAQAPEAELHGISAFGDLKYPVDFTRFDYVDPNAPKGGVFSQQGPTILYNQNFNTFNSLNSFILRGDAAQGMELTFATLMARAFDEPDAMYGLAARAVRISADGLDYRFLMRPGITFHDGTPITNADVAFSIAFLKAKGHPIIGQVLRDMESVAAEAPDIVHVRFKAGRARDLPLFVAALPIFSKAYYTAKNFEETTLDVPLGSGPYRVGRVDPGRSIEYSRVAGWWGEALPVSVGQNNFDTVRFEFFRDRDVAFEGFKAKAFLFREEFTSRIWATQYGFPAIKDGRVKRLELPDDTPSGGQGWFINTRREKFADPKVREALGLAFDFEWTNQNIMFGSYLRTASYFQNSPMMATGKPTGAELALLEPYRGKATDEVFGEAYAPPRSDGSGQDRGLLRRALALFGEAGFVSRNGRLLDRDGRQLAVEIIEYSRSFLPHIEAYVKNLKLLGIDATIRMVDAVQYEERRKNFDFDLTTRRFALSATPGESMRSYWSSMTAKLNGSNNLAGIADPVVDALIEKALAAETREDLYVACRALDRVLRAGRYWIPMVVQADPLDRGLGRVRPPQGEAALRPRRHPDLVDRCREAEADRRIGPAGACSRYDWGARSPLTLSLSRKGRGDAHGWLRHSPDAGW